MADLALFALLLVSSTQGQLPDVDLAPATAQVASAEKLLDEALSRQLSVQWQKMPLRQALRRVSDTARISILLDRRLDPDREVNLEINDESALKILERLAQDQSASVRRVGHTVYIGPARSAAIIRTLVALRRSELKQGTIPVSHQQALARRENFAWGDLSQPSDLVERAAKLVGLRVEGSEQIPHDLWSRGSFPQMSAAEMLTLLLIQYDSTFEWPPGGNGMRIVPLPRQVVITQPHSPPRGKTATQAAEEWRQAFPGTTFSVRAGEILVTALLEQHEAIELLKKPATTAPHTTAPVKSDDLSRQRFTMQLAQEVPLSNLIKKLSSPSGAGLSFAYNEEELKKAGINLEQRISLNVKSATIQTLLQKVLDQASLDFELRGRSVRLFPKRK